MKRFWGPLEVRPHPGLGMCSSAWSDSPFRVERDALVPQNSSEVRRVSDLEKVGDVRPRGRRQ